jgi:hypothetical protein
MSSPTGIQFTIASNPATQFAGAIASGANSGIVDLQLPKQLFGPSVLRSLVILSVQQLAWELDWFSNDSGEGATPGTDTWLGRWIFQEADGAQINAAGLYRYAIVELWQPYLDLQNYEVDGPQYFHLMLVNNDATPKNAGPTGAITIQATFSPMAREG